MEYDEASNLRADVERSRSDRAFTERARALLARDGEIVERLAAEAVVDHGDDHRRRVVEASVEVIATHRDALRRLAE